MSQTIAHFQEKVLAYPERVAKYPNTKNYHQSILNNPSTPNFDRESLAIGGQD
jgi:hypothetical protein